MVIRVRSLKGWLWFCTILLLVFSFPIQVYTKSPYPSLFPYWVIGLIISLTLLFQKKGLSHQATLRRTRNMNLMVVIYVCLLMVNTAWQTSFGLITLYEGATALTIFLLPVVFYWYFRGMSSEQEIRRVLLAMVVCGFVGGCYFVYESFVSVVLNQVTDYAQESFQYSLDRSDASVNIGRITTGSGGFGLLERHTVSAAWIVLGTLAALAILPSNGRVSRRHVVVASGTMILMTFSFAVIAAFAFIMFFLEFRGIELLRGRMSARIWRQLMSLVVFVGVTVPLFLLVTGSVMADAIIGNISRQIFLMLGIGEIDRSIFVRNALGFGNSWDRILDFPHTLLFGDGFSSFGTTTGGDFGLRVTVARFGLPFFLAVVFGLCILIRSGLRQVQAIGQGQRVERGGLDRGRVLQFAVGVTALVLINEGHYSLWIAKSILPIVFFALALYDRYLDSPHRGLYHQPDWVRNRFSPRSVYRYSREITRTR